ALVSGGKDSIYAAYLSDTQGWPVDELVTIVPEEPDAMMFHPPNLELVALQEAIEGDRGPVVAGAIQSSYQWARLLRIASGVGRRVYTPLWRKEPVQVVREEIAAGLDIRLVHLAAEPLTPDLLGRRLDLGLVSELERRSREVRPVNVAGEGGEFETLVVDAPFFRERIESEVAERSVTGSTSCLRITKARLVPKEPRLGPSNSS